MGQVEQVLVVGVGVHRGHQAAHDDEGVVEHLDHGHEAVGGARRIGDHDVLLGVELVVVDADHERVVGVARGGRDDDPLHPTVQVTGGVGPGGEAPGGLDHHVGAELVPGQLLGLAFGHDPDVLVADQQVAAFDVDRHRRAAGGQHEAGSQPWP